MAKNLRSFLDLKLLKFLGVGVANTLLSTILMFGLYNLTELNYWWSSAIAYAIGAAFSFFLNRAFTFRDKGGIPTSALRFLLTVSTCYIIAFSLAKPLVALGLTHTGASPSTLDQIAMLVAMVIYTGLNYILQRIFVFKQQSPDPRITNDDPDLESTDER
ncbi:MAG: GtrA family protein [Propionibacteriaceae bacterium]|jgi:putative flippase GtrA|nr:GtrA family protein [Propionibacteriaceae bacterium]